jgi:ABC-type transport system involved in cytochrome c biogenesis permease subunit
VSRLLRHAARVALALGLVVLLPRAAPAQDGTGGPAAAGPEVGRAVAPRRAAPWSERTLELARTLPVQDGGRVKPLGTYAGFTLLRLNGRRSVTTPDRERLDPVAWLLDVLFFPQAACDYPTFLVQDADALSAIGVPHEGRKKRDRWTFNELRPGLERLFELGRQYGLVEEKERSTVQQQVFLLATNVHAFLQVAGHLDFARHVMDVPPGGELARILGGRERVRFSDVLDHASDLYALYTRLGGGGQGDAASPELEPVADLLGTSAELATNAEALALIPPVATKDADPEWKTPSDLFARALQGEPVAAEHAAILAGFEALAARCGDPAGFERELASLHDEVRSLAERRGEYDKIGLEVLYYRWQVVPRSLYLFLGAFLAAAFMWLHPRGRLLYAATTGLVLCGALMLVAGIVLRCVIRGRPPVSTLYETVLFVTAVGSIVALFTEAVSRQRIAISAAAAVGVIGMFVANGYETLDKQDTMPSLVAVLDTNFWLSTHVTSVTIGYSAGMLAALLASAYLVVKLLGVRRGDRRFYANLARMVYGVLCFGLIFSVVGTILGGIWANESWGRFWGWDPKENGALLIVLWEIAILHARMAGLLREHGTCMAAAFGGTVVAFSWWGVNLLGVGLHSYGFTSGIHTALWTYYAIQWGLVALGGLAWLRERRARAAPPARAARRRAREEKPSEVLST